MPSQFYFYSIVLFHNEVVNSDTLDAERVDSNSALVAAPAHPVIVLKQDDRERLSEGSVVLDIRKSQTFNDSHKDT